MLEGLGRQLVVRLRDPYVMFCAGVIAVWLIAWLLAFHNLYGWLIDDQDTFARYQHYAAGGWNPLDIEWFHAYIWFVALPPWLFHWSVPSHAAPRAWNHVGEFRALIVYTIFLQAVVLALLARLLRQLCASRAVAAGAFLIVVTSPTLALFTPAVDNRFLGFLAVLPALILMLQRAKRGTDSASSALYIGSYILAGFLIGVGSDIHYECLYLAVPFATVYWALKFVGGWGSRTVWASFLAFCLGLACWFVPVQLLSLYFHPFSASYIGTLLTQYRGHEPHYTPLENISAWVSIFLSEMGIPMMLAVAAGTVVLALDRLRPSYVRRFDGQLMVGCILVFAAYILVSPTFPFYRMAFGLQFFYVIAAVAFLERLTSYFFPRSMRARWAFGVALLLTIALVPTFVRTPEVFAAQQGFGKAVNLAYERAAPNHVYFIDVFDMEAVPKAITSRKQFESLSPDDYLVTYFPETFFFKYPDLFALLNDTSPIASYPSLWCTKEWWAQEPTFFGTRRWDDEPPLCEARVFHVADIRRAAGGPRLQVASVSADSSALPCLGPRRVFALREPSGSWRSLELWRPYWDLWLSQATSGEHWLDVSLVNPERIGTITIVPPDFRVPPDFLWSGRKRVENMRIFGGRGAGPLHLLWGASDLQNRVIFTATFPPENVSRLHFVMWQGAGPNPAVGLKYIRFPEYRQVTPWPNHDRPGYPPPQLLTTMPLQFEIALKSPSLVVQCSPESG